MGVNQYQLSFYLLNGPRLLVETVQYPNKNLKNNKAYSYRYYIYVCIYINIYIYVFKEFTGILNIVNLWKYMYIKYP